MNDRNEDPALATWDMSLTGERVRIRWGDEQLKVLRPVLRAVAARLVHARLHFQDYQRLVQQHLHGPLQSGMSWDELMWIDDEQGLGASNRFFLAAEGYVYASAQAQHAIADNLAHVAYYGLGWNMDQRIPNDKVSLATVRSRLKMEAEHSPELRQILQPLDALYEASSYRALSDVTNHIKHHGGLPVQVSWGMSPEYPYGIFLETFTRRGEIHPRRQVEAFFEETFDTLNRAVVATGCALNEWLGRDSAHG